MTELLSLLLTDDAVLSQTLQSELGVGLELLVTSDPSDFLTKLGQGTPPVVVIDFRNVLQGGHGEARLLEQMFSKHPQLTVIVLLPHLAPETIERSIACSPAASLREPVDLRTLAQLLKARASRKPNVQPEAKPRDARLHLPPAPLPRFNELPAHSAQFLKPQPVHGHAHPPHSTLPHTEPAPRVSMGANAMPGSQSEYTVQGLTRRFETNTSRMSMMLSDLEVAARHDITVLLIGETGAGKTFLSKLVHEISPRANEPFLPVPCGALPPDLIESELFGHVKGSFTGAYADKEGKFLAAGKGTILLDEIDVLGLEQQVKLLRVIESGEFEPVGSNITYKCEARLIVASNLDLQPLVEQGKFRPDLYYRLNMLKFDILPLRQRRPDIIPLARRFVHEHGVKHNVRIDRIDEGLFQALMRYPWPGNVRELEHVIQRAVIYCRDGILTAQHLPTHVVMCQAGPSNEGHRVADVPDYSDLSNTLAQQRALTEREVIEQTLFKNSYSRTNTAKALGISRVTLYNKMKKYGMTK